MYVILSLTLICVSVFSDQYIDASTMLITSGLFAIAAAINSVGYKYEKAHESNHENKENKGH